jgi:hypothetical protein
MVFLERIINTQTNIFDLPGGVVLSGPCVIVAQLLMLPCALVKTFGPEPKSAQLLVGGEQLYVWKSQILCWVILMRTTTHSIAMIKSIQSDITQ